MAALDHFFDLPFWAKLLICWLISPGAMIIIAPIFEGRFLPLRKGQWLSFMPGDLFLGISAAGVFHAAALGGVHSGSYPVLLWLSLIVASVIASVLTWVEAKGYANRRAMISPTKIYHNLCLYAVYGGFMAWAFLATCLNRSWSPYSWMGVVAIAIWGGILVGEGYWLKSHPDELQLRLQRAHIGDWKPFRDPRSYHYPQQ